MDKKKDKSRAKSITNTLKRKLKKCGRKLKRDLMKIEEDFNMIEKKIKPEDMKRFIERSMLKFLILFISLLSLSKKGGKQI